MNLNMKKLINPTLVNGKPRRHEFAGRIAIFALVLLSIMLVPGCTKQEKVADQNETKAKADNVDEELNNFYSGLNPQTLWELQQVRAATARYRDAKNAFKDNYVDINLKL